MNVMYCILLLAWTWCLSTSMGPSRLQVHSSSPNMQNCKLRTKIARTIQEINACAFSGNRRLDQLRYTQACTYKTTHELARRCGTDLEHEVVRDVGLASLHGLQHKGVPHIEEGSQVHQHRVGKVTQVHSPFSQKQNIRYHNYNNSPIY